MSAVREDAVLDLIDHIYEAGLFFSRWPDALVRMADLLDARDASLGAMAPDGLSWIFAPRTDPDYLRSYAQAYHPLNDVWHGVTRREVGRATSDAMVMPRNELVKSAFHNEWSRPQGYSTIMGSVILAERGWQTVLMLPGRDPFDRDRLDLLELLAPHLRRAVQMNIRLMQGDLDSRTTAALLENAATAAFVIDGDARLLFANPAAEALFESGALPRGDRLAASELGALAMRCAMGGPAESGGVIEIAPSSIRPLRLQVTPLRRECPLMAPGLPVALVVDVTATDPPDRARQLRALYGLTTAESAFALEIVKGDGKAAAAARLGISYATARTHLSRIFEKTGVHRQAELVSLLLG